MTSRSPFSTSHLFALALGTALLIAACSGPAQTTTAPGLPENFPNHSANDIRKEILGATDTLQSYSAKARITVQSPKQNRTFNAVVRHRRSDSLFMRFSLFGVEGGRLLLTRDSVFFYNSRNAVLRVGPIEAVQQIFPAPVTSEKFFQNMLGLIAPDPSTNWSLQSDSSLYYFSGPADRTRYVVDPTRWRVVRYEEQTQAGTVVQKRLFSNFRPVEDVLLPSMLIFQQPAEDLRATVRYKEMNLNPEDLSFALNIPSQVPRKPFTQDR